MFPLGFQLGCALLFAAGVPGSMLTVILDSQWVQRAHEPAKQSDDIERSESGRSPGVSYSHPRKNRWRVGVKIVGGSRSAKNLFITIPVPVEWPEQRVIVKDENIPPDIRSVEYRELNSGVRQLVVSIDHLSAKQLIELSVVFDVTTFQINGPTETSEFEIPTRVPREVKEYLGVSPQISYRNARLRDSVSEIISQPETAWEKVEALFDWVRNNIEYHTDAATDTLTVFHNRSGSNEDRVGLFVAMCRAAKIPARMVWVEGAEYAEFYLVDSTGEGHWFPCQFATRGAFGSRVEPQVILQKGDNIKVPEKEQRQKFCTEFVSGAGNAKPVVKFIRGPLPPE